IRRGTFQLFGEQPQMIPRALASPRPPQRIDRFAPRTLPMGPPSDCELQPVEFYQTPSVMRVRSHSPSGADPALPEGHVFSAGAFYRRACSRSRGRSFMSLAHVNIIAVQPLVALIFGILILLVPRFLNYFVAIYLILIGLVGL